MFEIQRDYRRWLFHLVNGKNAINYRMQNGLPCFRKIIDEKWMHSFRLTSYFAVCSFLPIEFQHFEINKNLR